jgi:protocatechuate 3,4-dioxygenase beta subunit
MNRRAFLVALPALSAALTLRPEGLHAQDVEFIRAWERAQRDRPPRLTSRARLAPAGEPGIPLVIRGRLFQPDGRTPARGIRVFAYHTDSTGLYAERSKGPHVWRLRGWVETDAGGGFHFDTIRPAPYPGRATPAHVHVSIEGPGVPRRFTADVLFADDDLVGADEREASARQGMFGAVRAVEVRDGVQTIVVNLRIEERGLF